MLDDEMIRVCYVVCAILSYAPVNLLMKLAKCYACLWGEVGPHNLFSTLPNHSMHSIPPGNC